ncbi:MAG: site-specific integrase [Bacteroidaceae bacterium]|nr:site-specific integrase [Bacteroidaceae bacterium]
MAIGSIRKRTDSKGNVTYQITLELDRDPITGVRHRRYHTVHGSKREAQEMLKKLLLNPDENLNAVQSSIRLRDWMRTWLDEYLPHIAQTTRDGYEEKIRNHISPVLGGTPINQLDTTQIQRFINSRIDRGMAPKSIRALYNNLNASLNKAVQLKILGHNPCTGVVLPKLKRYQSEVYDAEQIQHLLEIAKQDSISAYAICILGALLGLRRGEMTALRWEQVDFVNKKVTICENRVQSSKGVIEKAPKSESGIRTITIGKKALDALRYIKDFYDDACRNNPWFHGAGYVLFKEDGQPYRPDCVTQLWGRFIQRTDLPYIRLHDLRHTNATLLIANDVSARVVQHRLGHADVSTTLQRYVHVQPAMDEAAADKIDSAIFD